MILVIGDALDAGEVAALRDAAARLDFDPGLFVQIQLGRLRAPERAVESGCYTALTPKSEIFRV
jgi:hypothetical protein